MKKAICIGSALKDIFMPTGDGVVTETPEDLTARRKITFELGAKYRIENRYTAAGGCALNVSIGLARLGMKAAPYALVGGDATGAWIRQTLAENNVDTSLVRQVSRAQSDLSMILVDRQTGERVIFVNRDLQETLVVDPALIDCDSLVFVGALSGRWRENFAAVLRAVDRCGCCVAYNPGQSNMAEDMETVKKVIAKTTFLFLNRDEATEILLSGNDVKKDRLEEVPYLIEKLRQMGPETVVVTAGLAGAWLHHKNKTVFVPSSGERPVDATGAGDAFASGVLAAVADDADAVTAAAWGALNAAEVVRHYGSNKGLLCRREMLRLQDTVKEKVKVLSA